MLRATTSCLSTPNSFMNSSNRCVNKQVTFSHQHSPVVAQGLMRIIWLNCYMLQALTQTFFISKQEKFKRNDSISSFVG